MIERKDDLIKRFDAFEDTHQIAEWLYEMAHDEDSTDSAQRYMLMEARDNLLGLFDMCRSFVVHEMNDKHKKEFGNTTSITS